MSETSLQDRPPPGRTIAALAPAPGPATERRIEPATKRLRFRDLVGDLAVIRVMAARDFKVKYKQSALGPIWLFFQPLALLGALIVAFSRFPSASDTGVPYALFALTGLCIWTYVQASLHIGTASIVSSYQLVRRTSCPRLAFPLASLVASLPALAIPFCASVVLAAVTGHLSARVVLVPFGILWVFLFTLGIVGILSAMAVRSRDILNGLPFLLQVAVFVAPIGYSTDKLSGTLHLIVSLNPLTGIIEAWRWMLLEGMTVDLFALGVSVGGTAMALLVGWNVFARLEVTMADDI